LDPCDSIAFNNIGVLLTQLKRDEEAIKHYDKAIELNPNYSKAFLNRGISLRALKKYNESIQSFDKSITANSNLDAYFHRANVFFEVFY
jgi:tetratricopeptide (TPR) repeat protein